MARITSGICYYGISRVDIPQVANPRQNVWHKHMYLLLGPLYVCVLVCT
jgi:hypothetical protein